MDLIYLVEKEMFRRKYSPKTIQAYKHCLGNYLKWLKKDIKKTTRQDVSDYLFELSKNHCGSTLNVHLQAILFAMKNILGKRWFVDFPYSRRPQKLPEVLSKEEVKTLIGAISNEKHKLMIKVMYSAGLRVSELLNLKAKDISHDFGWVREGKGRKDRPFIIAESIKQELFSLIEDKKDDDFVFSTKRGKYSVRTVQEIVSQACRKAGIRKVHPHTLRHSFATHLIENGYAVQDVQALLGHSKIDTTMIYVHLANPKLLRIKSPIDG